MAHCERRTPLHRHLSTVRFALLLLSLAASSFIALAKPLDNGEQLQPASHLLARVEALSAAKPSEDASSVSASPLSPAVETARKMWNNYRQFRRSLQPKRYVRTVTDNSANVNSPGAEYTRNSTVVPKYIMELYENLTQLRNSSTEEQLHQQTTQLQANTVRSLQVVNENYDPSKCKTFNFSIRSINSSELVMKAEVRLHLEKLPDPPKDIFVAVQSEKRIGNSIWEITKTINLDNIDSAQNQEYIFDVTSVLYQLVKQNDSHAKFTVKVYESEAKYDTGVQMTCSNVRFVHTSTDIEIEPMLIVHSYDFELENIDYQRTLQNLNRTEVRRRRSTTELDAAQRDRRNNNSNVPFCNIYKLDIMSHEIPKMHGETVISPSQYNAGICGGDCRQSFPVDENINHNHLIHMLQSTAEFRDRHGYEITRCCAPISYVPLSIIVQPPVTSDLESQAWLIRIIPNMKVYQCGCLEVVNFTV